MLIGFIDYVLVEEDQELPVDEPQFAVIEPRVQRYLAKLARETAERCRAARSTAGCAGLDRVDLDGDGELDASELSSLGVTR